jgi:hypothetical protein
VVTFLLVVVDSKEACDRSKLGFCDLVFLSAYMDFLSASTPTTDGQ